jgi:peptidoglycan/xylan/chitin deacetylase (PgdA/CDA1 family)
VPESRPPAVVHVDLDGATHIYRAHGWRYNGQRDALFASGLQRTLEILEKRGIAATLFVIAEDLNDPAKKDLILEAARRGHEIASHTMTHRHLTRLTVAERRTELQESREVLEQALGVPVSGLRAPGFVLDEETLVMAAEAGYQYDSSAFIGHKAPRGALSVGSDVQRLERVTGLRELGLPSYAGLPWPFHPSYSLLLGARYFGAGLDRALRSSVHPFVFLMHLTDLADPLDSSVLTGWRSRIYTLSLLPTAVKERRIARMLDLVQQRCTLVPTRALLEPLQ